MNKVGLCRNPRLLRGCCCRFCCCCLNLSLSSYFSHVNHSTRAPIVPKLFSLRLQPSTCRSWSYKGKLVIKLTVSISRNSLINNAALLSDVCILDTRQVTNYGWYPLIELPKEARQVIVEVVGCY